MITRAAIKNLMKAGLITVTPEPLKIGPNSIDLRLGDSLKMYHPTEGRVRVEDPVTGKRLLAIDPKNPPPLIDVPKIRHPKGMETKHCTVGPYEFVPRDEDVGRWLLVPGQFYLGVTLEETYCRGVIPHLDGRSTCGRLSIEAHKTAGVGDNGFRGRWTLEIEVTEPVLVSPGDRLFQVYFTPAWGEGVALIIRSMYGQPDDDFADREQFIPHLDGTIDLGMMQDGCAAECGPLIELHDLYGKDGGHHYQGSKTVKAPSPLD